MPALLDDEYVSRQLRSQFLIEQSTFFKKAYFYSERYGRFLARFRILSAQTWPTWTGTALNGVYILLFQLFDGQLAEFAFGKSKIYVKSFKTVGLHCVCATKVTITFIINLQLIDLEEWRSLKLTEVATKIQKNVRSWIQQRKYQRMVLSQIRIVRYYRNWKVSLKCKVWSSVKTDRPIYSARGIFVGWQDTSLHDLLWLETGHQHRSFFVRVVTCSGSCSISGGYVCLQTFQTFLNLTLTMMQCQRYRSRFDQTNRNRMREKVTAMALFRNRKVSYRSSLSHPFRGDYIRLRQNVKWKRLLPTLGEVYVVFADLVSKITKRCGKVRDTGQLVCITEWTFFALSSYRSWWSLAPVPSSFSTTRRCRSITSSSCRTSSRSPPVRSSTTSSSFTFTR